jgi:hypothetical protein
MYLCLSHLEYVSISAHGTTTLVEVKKKWVAGNDGRERYATGIP